MPGRRSALAALALGALGALGPPGESAAQAADTVRIVLTGEGVAVEQRLAPEGGRVRALALRIEGQSLDVYEVVREGEALLDASLVPERGVHVFEVKSGAPLLIRYAVTGTLERIPLFVPARAAELTVARTVEEPHLVRLVGPADELARLDLAGSLPRWTAGGEGALEARLSSLPALVRLSSYGLVSFTRIADLVALGLIVLGVAWGWRTARLEPSRAMRSVASPAGPAPDGPTRDGPPDEGPPPDRGGHG